MEIAWAEEYVRNMSLFAFVQTPEAHGRPYALLHEVSAFIYIYIYILMIDYCQRRC